MWERGGLVVTVKWQFGGTLFACFYEPLIAVLRLDIVQSSLPHANASDILLRIESIYIVVSYLLKMLYH